jgi:acyl-coenzyme A thioesterase PaaI-like protein
MEKVPSYRPCFFCGKENPHGMKMEFFAEGDEVKGEFQVPEHYCGYQGFIHGGILAGVLDEVMWWAASWQRACSCLTMEISVRYQRPAPIDRRYQVSARIEEDKDKVVEAVGEIQDLMSGEVCVTGTGRYYMLAEERDFDAIACMDFSGCSKQTRKKYGIKK